MGFIQQSVLEELMRSGRFKLMPTVVVVDVGSGPGIPPEAVLAKPGLWGNPPSVIGECWTGDLEKVLALAADEGDTDRINPNLPVLRKTFEAMQRMRVTREEGRERIDAFEASKIKPFPSPKM
jgi:hypothetical protein